MPFFIMIIERHGLGIGFWENAPVFLYHFPMQFLPLSPYSLALMLLNWIFPATVKIDDIISIFWENWGSQALSNWTKVNKTKKFQIHSLKSGLQNVMFIISPFTPSHCLSLYDKVGILPALMCCREEKPLSSPSWAEVRKLLSQWKSLEKSLTKIPRFM